MDSSHSDTDLKGEPSEPLVLGRRMETLRQRKVDPYETMQQPLPQQRWMTELCNYPAGNQLVIKTSQKMRLCAWQPTLWTLNAALQKAKPAHGHRQRDLSLLGVGSLSSPFFCREAICFFYWFEVDPKATPTPSSSCLASSKQGAAVRACLRSQSISQDRSVPGQLQTSNLQ